MADNIQPSGNVGPSSDYINEQTALGQKYKSSQESSRYKFSNPNIASSPSVRNQLIATLMGASQGGSRAMEVARTGSSIASFLAGMAGSAGAPTAMQLEQQDRARELELQQKEFDNQPFSAFAPGLAAELGISDDVPLSAGIKLAPVLEQSLNLKRRYMEDFLNPHEQYAIEKKQGLKPGALNGIRKGVVDLMLANSKDGKIDPFFIQAIEWQQRDMDALRIMDFQQSAQDAATKASILRQGYKLFTEPPKPAAASPDARAAFNKTQTKLDFASYPVAKQATSFEAPGNTYSAGTNIISPESIVNNPVPESSYVPPAPPLQKVNIKFKGMEKVG